MGRVRRAARLHDVRDGPGPHVDRCRRLPDGADGGDWPGCPGAPHRRPPVRPRPTSGPYRPMSTSRRGWSRRTCSMRRISSCATEGREPCSAHWRPGVPVVVVPLFADQFENGGRVADRGAGLVIEPEHRAPRRSPAQPRGRGCSSHRRRDQRRHRNGLLSAQRSSHRARDGRCADSRRGPRSAARGTRRRHAMTAPTLAPQRPS